MSIIIKNLCYIWRFHFPLQICLHVLTFGSFGVMKTRVILHRWGQLIWIPPSPSKRISEGNIESTQNEKCSKVKQSKIAGYSTQIKKNSKCWHMEWIWLNNETLIIILTIEHFIYVILLSFPLYSFFPSHFNVPCIL